MIEIIPNWHPVFVHFTVALLSLSVVMFVVALFPLTGTMRQEVRIVAQWTLWLGAALSLVTAYTGWLAYDSVDHDDQSHLAMTDHRNWALATLAVFVALAGWSLWARFVRAAPERRLVTTVFTVLLLVGGGMLAATAWRGGELVYRHGLGVLSLPNMPSPDRCEDPDPSLSPARPVHDHSTHKH